MASSGNQHSAGCIGALSFPMGPTDRRYRSIAAADGRPAANANSLALSADIRSWMHTCAGKEADG